MRINDEYDIEKAFRAIEEELIASMMRNLGRHRSEETKEGFNWEMWQVKQLEALERYKQENKKKFSGTFSDISKSIDAMIKASRTAAGMEQEHAILKAIKKGLNAKRTSQGIEGVFFHLNTRKLEALIKATQSDFARAEHAMLRMANDQYRKVIFNAQIYAATGAGTYEKAVDMATKDFLYAGINCIEYGNGSRHTMEEYAKMAIQTANKRAYLTGEGEMRQAWGISTVIMNKRQNPCHKCRAWAGKVLIDDVWSGGSKDGISEVTGRKYPLMSQAVAAGLYHPNCRDIHTTYLEGISSPPDGREDTKEELERLAEDYRQQQRRQYANRQSERYGRLAGFSLDAANKRAYKARQEEWKKRSESLKKRSEALTLSYDEEGAVIRYKSPDSYALNDKLRRNALTELTELEKNWINHLNSALEKLPAYKGKLRRSIWFKYEEDAKELYDTFIVGKEYIANQYLSTTKRGVYNDDGQIQICIKVSRKGRDLESISTMEHEVLYPMNSRFKVKKKRKRNGKYHITMKEN